MDCQETINNCTCPLLKNPDYYSSDSVDLLEDEEARTYWLKCLEGLGYHFVEKASYLHPDDASACDKAKKCKDSFHEVLSSLRNNPAMFGQLSVRSLLDLNEHIIRENGFKDAWLHQKNVETTAALRNAPARFSQIDAIDNQDARWKELCKGVIAGNMFDWGAKAIVDLFENCENFGMKEALSKIQPRPWLVDDLDSWVLRLKGSAYKCVVIFVDNAGIDLILGILPLAREFLKRGSTVILSANSKPALNDVTHLECEIFFNRAMRHCSIIEDAIANNKLQFFESGGIGPCLDLRNLHAELCEAMRDVDLIILEGMGRAVHTNLYARFNVDCLKVAVIKNEWWAKRLGGKKFSVLFKYEPIS